VGILSWKDGMRGYKYQFAKKKQIRGIAFLKEKLISGEIP